MNKISFSPEAWEDYLYWQSQDKKTFKKINDLIKDIMRNGTRCYAFDFFSIVLFFSFSSK